MDKETLSHYGWIVVLVLVLSVLIAMATPFGDFIKLSTESTLEGLFDTSDKALGVLGQSAKTPPEVKYYQPYKAEMDGAIFEMVFHKDGSIDLYIQIPTGEQFGEIVPPGFAQYKDGKIYTNGEEFTTIAEDGKSFVAQMGNEPLTFTLVPTPIKPLYFDTEYISIDGNLECGMTFAEDGSADYREYEQGEEVYHWQIDEGTMRYYSEYFEEYYSDDEIYRYAVYPNGTKIIMGGYIYEVSCTHENTEIRNQTANYTGDKYCTVCDKLIERGMYLTGGAYALYLESTNTLVFTRSDTEIKVGDIYDGKTVTAVYTGYEEDMYTVGGGKMRAAAAKESTVPWFEYAYDITNVRFDCIVKPAYTVGWFYCFEQCSNLDLSRLDMSNVVDASHMFECSGIVSIPKMNIGSKTTIMEYMFKECYDLTDIGDFNISNCVTNISYIFGDCENVLDFSNIVIPSSVIYMDGAFSDCNSMTKAPNMNNATNVLYMSQAFWKCSSLIVAPNIPSAEYMSSTFEDCTSLTTIPLLPSNVIIAYNVFADCPSVITYVGNTDGNGNFKNYPIPSGVEDLSSIFRGCKLITAVPDLDHCTKLTQLDSAFRDCDALIYAPKLPASIENISMMFYCCDNLETAPHLEHCTNLKDMSYAFEACRKLKEAPIIPHCVENMKETFSLCSGMVTYHGSTDPDGDFSKYVIPGTVKTLYNAFDGCSGLVKGPIVEYGVEDMRYAFASCRNLISITIHANPTQYTSCFSVAGIVNDLNPCADITLYGSSELLQELANTSKVGNRTIYDENGNILRE